MVRLHAGSFNHCQMSCIATTATNLGIRFVAVKFYLLLFSTRTTLQKQSHDGLFKLKIYFIFRSKGYFSDIQYLFRLAEIGSVFRQNII